MNRQHPQKSDDSDPLIEADDHVDPFIEIDTKNRSGRLNIAPRHQIVLVYALGILLVLSGFAAILGTAAYLASVIDFKLSHLDTLHGWFSLCAVCGCGRRDTDYGAVLPASAVV